MTLRIENGQLVQSATPADYLERRISSLGRRLVKNNGGQIESKGNYGAKGTTYSYPDGTSATLETARHFTLNK